jgi:hypothetical protein
MSSRLLKRCIEDGHLLRRCVATCFDAGPPLALAGRWRSTSHRAIPTRDVIVSAKSACPGWTQEKIRRLNPHQCG